jgi:hypothetical protein
VAQVALGDPPKRVVKRLVRSMPGHAVRCDYLAYHDMDHSNPERRAAFLERVNEHSRLGETVRLAPGAARREIQAARLWSASDI